MKTQAGDRSRRTLTAFLAGLSALWLLSVLAPKLLGEQTQFATGFFLGLLLLSTLRWATRFTTGSEQAFWGWLTIACALGLLGNVAWGLYEMIAETDLGIFTWVDGLYIARYVSIFWALWYFSRPWSQKQWIAHGVVLIAATGLVWALFFRPDLAMSAHPLLVFFGGALYSIMDLVLVYSAASAWFGAGSSRERVFMGWFVAALILYSAANWINFGLRALMTSDALSIWASLCWGSSDILSTLAALYALRPMPVNSETTKGATS